MSAKNSTLWLRDRMRRHHRRLLMAKQPRTRSPQLFLLRWALLGSLIALWVIRNIDGTIA